MKRKPRRIEAEDTLKDAKAWLSLRDSTALRLLAQLLALPRSHAREDQRHLVTLAFSYADLFLEIRDADDLREHVNLVNLSTVIRVDNPVDNG